MTAADLFWFKADGAILFVADFLGAADVLFVFYGVALFALAAVGLLCCLSAYMSVCQFVRLSTPEPPKITVKVRSKPKYFSDIIFGPVLVFAFNS